MAHIQRRKGKSGTTYRVRYTDPEGREKSRTFKRKAAAEDFLTETAHTVRAGSYVDPAAGAQTVQAYLEEWRRLQSHHRANTAKTTTARFRTMVYPLIGHLPLARVRSSTVASWQTALLATGRYAPRTIVGVRGQVAGAFNDAVRDRRIVSNPFDGVKAPEVVDEKVVPRTIAQVEAGRAAMTNERYRAVIRVVAGTGLRWGEVFGLTVDRIDFLRREIRVDRQLVGRDGKTPLFGPPKTAASDRTVPVGDLVIGELAAHLERWPARPGELVFRTAQRSPLTREVWVEAWRPAQTAMGLAPGEGLHQLRHFYASLLIADGRNVKEVQERLGHKSATETLDTYAHLMPDGEDRTRSAIDDAFAALEQVDEEASDGS